MTEHGTLPWSMAAIELAYLHRHDRVLVAGVARVGVVDAIAHQVGARGTVLVVEPDRSLAEQIADRGMPQVEVLAMAPVGERFGAFDALLCCPWTMPPWPPESFCELALLNLRPGGRFVLDLPGPEMLPDLAACWPDCGGAEDGRRHAQILQHGQRREDLAPLRHIADAETRASIGRQVRHIPALELHLSAGGAHSADEGLQKRGLAHAVVAEDAYELALGDCKGDAVQDLDAPVSGGKVGDGEHGHAAACRPR